MERDYSERMVKTEVLKARGVSRDSLLVRGNSTTSESKLTFNITYYPARFSMSEASCRNFKFDQHLTKSIKKFFLRFRQWDSEMVKALRTTQSEQRYQRWIMIEVLNHVGRVLVKCVAILLQLTLLQQKHVGKHLKFKVDPLKVTQKKSFTF